jgi:hypothetical protein
MLAYFTAIWYILWLFGIFLLFWYVVPRKIWQPRATIDPRDKTLAALNQTTCMLMALNTIKTKPGTDVMIF